MEYELDGAELSHRSGKTGESEHITRAGSRGGKIRLSKEKEEGRDFSDSLPALRGWGGEGFSSASRDTHGIGGKPL